MSRGIRCALSSIRVYTDLSRPGGRSILVGYVAELTTPERRVMGLVGRQNLDQEEMSEIHGLLRHRVSAIAVVDRAREPVNGSIILALLDGAFTVKRYRIRDGAVVLQAENPAFGDMQIAEGQTFEVWGVITRSIRML
jgi:hypothetical protein